MTNGEWLESKWDNFVRKFRDNFVRKFKDWIYKHIWVPIIILAIFIGVTIYAAISIDVLFVMFLVPLDVFEVAFISIAVCRWLDKEHKEKIR